MAYLQLSLNTNSFLPVVPVLRIYVALDGTREEPLASAAVSFGSPESLTVESENADAICSHDHGSSATQW